MRMIDEHTLAQINGPYVCPPDAGPAWRAACEYGFDMSLVEDALTKTPEQRLEEHQHALELALEILTFRELNHGSK
jgi:hypothetical protein